MRTPSAPRSVPLPYLLAGGRLAPIALLLASMVGCHSRFVEATLENQGSSAIHLVEVDYPSATFGTQSLEPGAQYHYRFKIQGSGNVKLSYTDAQGKTHTSTGPELEDGQEGTLKVTIDATGAVGFEPRVSSHH